MRRRAREAIFFPYTLDSIIDCILEASHFDDREHPNLNFSPNLIVGSILVIFSLPGQQKKINKIFKTILDGNAYISRNNVVMFVRLPKDRSVGQR